jgi:hypothetical protein
MNNFLRYFGNFRKTETGLREYVDYTGRKFVLNPMTQKWESGGMVLNEQQMSMFTLHSFDDPSGGGRKVGLVPIISLLFANALPSGVTFERYVTETTYLGSDGLIKRTTAEHEPRFEYDFNGNPLGLLIEGQSANRLVDGITFYNRWAASSAFIAAPANLGATLLSNAGTAPDNSNQANKIALTITPGSDASLASIFIKEAVGIETNNTSHVFSFWAKNTIGATYIAASMTHSTTADDKWFGMVADLSGNTFKTYQASTAPGITFASLERYPNDWYRISVGTTADSAKGISACIGIVNSFGASFSNIGEPKNTSISSSDPYGFTGLFWGAQVEAQFSPSSFIPTNGLVVTRFSESASFDEVTSALGENTTDIAILFEFDARLPASGFPYLGRLYDSATTQGISGAYNFYLARNIDKLNYYNEIKSVTVQNGVYTSTSNDITLSYTTGLNPKTLHKVAFTYNPNIVSAEALRSVNSESLSSTAGITQYPISLDKLFIGSLSKTANHLNGHIKTINIYNKKLPQTDINNLTK